MILTVSQLELQNFMTHREEEVRFPDQGIILLWGPSGAGKSSLLDAIGFALFGVTATRAQSLEELRHELYPEEDVGVRLTLSLGDGRHIQIFRGIEKGKSLAWLVDADGTLVEGIRGVGQRVSEIMGKMDGPTFFATYFSPQGELDALVRMQGGDRRKFVQRMLGVTLLDQVSRAVSRERSKAEERIAFLDESMPPQSKEELQELLLHKQQELEQEGARVTQFTHDLEAARVKGSSLREELDREQKNADRFHQLQPLLETLEKTTLPTLEREIVILSDRVQESSEAQNRLKEDTDNGQEIDGLRKEADKLSTAEGALQALERLKTEIEESREHSRTREKEVESLPQQAKEPIDPEALNQEYQDARAQWKVLEQQSREVRNNLQRLQLEEACFTCLRPLTHQDPAAKQALQGLQKRLEELELHQQEIAHLGQGLKERLANAREQQAQEENQRRAREKAETLFEETRRALQESETRLVQAQEAAKGSDSERLQVVRNRLESLAEQNARLQADRRLAKELPKLEQQLQKSKTSLEEESERQQAAKQELQELSFNPQAFAQLRTSLDQARTVYESTAQALREATEASANAQNQVQKANESLAQYDRVVQERKKAAEQTGQYKRLDGSIKDFKNHLIGVIRPALEARTSEHLAELTEGRMPAVSIEEEYNLSIKRHGQFRRIGLCSGGEKARAAFALRLALTQLVSQRTDTPVGFMVFDEIFGSQDEDHRQAILDSLSHLRGIYPQTFLISHEASLRDSGVVNTVIDIPDADSVRRVQVTNR